MALAEANTHALFAGIVAATRLGAAPAVRRRAERRLIDAGYTVRLSDELLRRIDRRGAGPGAQEEEEEEEGASGGGGLDCPCGARVVEDEYVRVIDGLLPASLMARLDALFGARRDEGAAAKGEDYFSAHGYPRGFFSYAFDVRDGDGATCLEQLAQCALSFAAERGWLDDGAERGAGRWRAEFWAHRRRRGRQSGHQLHFDSADEGRGGVRNPVVSSICFLTDDAGGTDAMGPTLITRMRRGDRGRLGEDTEGGVLVYPRRGRVAVFRGDLLHGVMPSVVDAAGDDGPDRITLMTAFWRADESDGADLAAARGGAGAGGDSDSPCAGMALPRPGGDGAPWTRGLSPVPALAIPAHSHSLSGRTLRLDSRDEDDRRAVRARMLVPIERVWTRVVVGAEPPRATQLPEYPKCFQGQ